MAGETPLERVLKRWELRSQLAFRQRSEDLGVMGAGDQRLEHQPPGDAEHLARDRGELDPRVLQRLLQPLDLAGALLDLRLAITGQIPQLADLPRRHETRPDQPVL